MEGQVMSTYEFVMTRTDKGTVIVEADNIDEAIEKAIDYTRKIVLVNNMAWYNLRTIDHNLVNITEGIK